MTGKAYTISKFGGSSMADAEAIRRSAKVAEKQGSNVIIVSAVYGTTNEILALVDTALKTSWEDTEPLLNNLQDKHLKIANDLELSSASETALNQLLQEMEALAKGICLLKDCSPKAKDNILSLGERISSYFMTEALGQISDRNIEFFDARDLILTNSNHGHAVPNIAAIGALAEKTLLPKLKEGKVLVSQGFIGKSAEGITTTIGRGGSDYSAALFAEAIDASLIEIWTDVAGVATTDPRLCKNARPIEEITYKEACELATFGAKVLHPTSLWPAMRKNIPVFVGSSIENEKKGTFIRNETKEKPLVRAIALRKNQSLVTLTTPRMVNTHGFLYNVFKIFNDHEISVDLVTTSEISVAITLNQETLDENNLIEELTKIGDVKVDQSLSLISLVGDRISKTPGLSKEVFSLLHDINIRMICQGASASNICFLVDQKDGAEAVSRIHGKFLES